MAVAAAAKPVSARQGEANAAPRGRARARPRVAAPFAGTLQAKMALGPVQDSYEREADRAAAHVVGGRQGLPSLSALSISAGGHTGSSAAAGVAQRACSACALSDDDRAQRVQRKCACGAAGNEPCSCKKEEEEHPEMQIDRLTKSGGGGSTDALDRVDSVVRSPGKPLPGPVRNDMEQGFGRSFGHVRVHDSPRASASAEAIGAHAYTVGNHIAFNRGKYQPGTESGRFLLAHELAHTVQQSGAPKPEGSRISQPGDAHETQANRAATAAVSGGPMTALSPGAAPISRYPGEGLVQSALDVGEAIIDAPGEAVDAVANVAGELWDTAVGIADAIGGAVSLDGTTIVISVPEFDPCPDIGFSLRLSDIGLDPTLYFPIAVGGFTVGAVTLIGSLGVEANLDPGLGFRLEDCSFGPGQIRISPLSGRATVAGMFSVTTSSMVQLGMDLGLRADVAGMVLIPATPPIPLIIPAAGIALGGTMEFMLQNRSTLTSALTASVGIGGVSAAMHLDNDVHYGMDLAYGLYGAISVLGMDLCRVGWPLDSIHEEIAANLQLSTAMSLNSSGLSFSYLFSARPLATSALADLSFAFDESRLEDDCWLCEFMTGNGLMPSQNGYDWAGILPTLPVLRGPLSGVFVRDPGLASGSLCRGTCGVNCPPSPTCDDPVDRVECQNVGNSHIWHTYVNYATCGSHQGCRDHDACYDFAATMPIWGFGGMFIGPMYRACDLDAMCTHSFQDAVNWAGGGGAQPERLAYADRVDVTLGCLGSCPVNAAAEGEEEIQQTCIEDRELWPGLEVSDSWGEEFFNERLFQGFVEVPWIIGVHYGVDAAARADADAFAQLGPISLKNACVIYDPATMTYSGTADLTLFLNGGASASITASLEGFLSDFLCLLNWVTLRGTMSAGIKVQFPTELTAGVDLFCANGDLQVRPRVSLTTCLDIFGDIRAGLDVFLLSFNVWSQEWPLIEKHIQQCWDIEFTFDPFNVGEMPKFDLESAALVLDTLLGELFEPANPQEIDRSPARNPLPAAVDLLFPCLDGDDDDDDDDGGEESADCPRKATGDDGDRLFTPAQRTPVWGSMRNVSISGGSSANVATVMEAEFLTKSITGGSDRTGRVQKGIYKHRGLPTAGCFTQSKKDSQHFIKGHLLNGKIGGPAEEKNLFPITALANGDHKRRVEQSGENVVGRVKGNDLMYYKVTVQNPSSPQEIMDSSGAGTGFFEISATFLCEVADYQFCTDDTVRRNQVRHVPVPSQFVFHPSGGDPFDQITDPSRCRR